MANFNIVLKCLIVNIAKLDNATSLITEILHYPWLAVIAKAASQPNSPYFTDRSAFVDLYAQFMTVLVSSFPRYLNEVVSKLICEFHHFSDSNATVYPHHRLLKRFVTFFPTCISSLPRSLSKNAPHHLSSSPSEIANFVRNSMTLLSYCPDLQYNVWQMIMELCISLDVDLQNELDDLDDDSIEELINGDEEIGDNEITEEKKEISEDNEDNEDDEVFEVTSTSNIKTMVAKLDTALELLLTITEPCFTKEEIAHGNGVNLFNTLASLFKTHILPTHFTKSVQFLVFHISQHQPELADSFLVLLIDVAFSTSETVEKRLKALQYLSSYISRAQNLTNHQVVFIVSYLMGWINKYINEREHEVFEFTDSSSGGMERFKMFYATFQALLYVFCFRHHQLRRETDDGEAVWESDIDKFFQRVIITKFNPLKYCDETVVYIFAKLATNLNVCYCYSIIEHNKRERMIQGNLNMPSSVGNFRHKQEFLDLEAYFPFDPLVLPASKKIISRNYVEWALVNPVDDDDDEDSGSHPEEDDEEIDSDSDSDEAPEKDDDGESADEGNDGEVNSDGE